jgi:hypothetical protein
VDLGLRGLSTPVVGSAVPTANSGWVSVGEGSLTVDLLGAFVFVVRAILD